MQHNHYGWSRNLNMLVYYNENIVAILINSFFLNSYIFILYTHIFLYTASVGGK